MTDNTDPLFSSSGEDKSPPPIPDNHDHDFVSDLVGEGKKFKDVQALARSILHKEGHIRDIEKENAELRQLAQQGLTREEFYEAIKTLQTTPSPSNQSPQGGEPERTLSLEQVASLAKQTVQEHLTEAKQNSNLQYAVSEAEKRLGSGFQRILNDRARELGESPSDLTKLARKNPTLFLELMAPVKKTETHIPGLPRSETDPAKGVPQSSGVRNQSYYKELKKRDRKAYDSQTTQIQMHKDALALGEAFFQ